MAIRKHTCVQGDAYNYNLVCTEVSELDTNWTGSWAIVEALDDITDGNDLVTLASGVLALSDDLAKLELRIPAAATTTIPVASYKLVVSVINVGLSFSKEVLQDPFKITKQGIV